MESITKKFTLACVKQIANGNLLYGSGLKKGFCINLEGWVGVGDGREVQKGGDICIQFSSASQLFLTLCDPMNRSTLGLPVHHQLPESTQTHAHRVGDAIQPSHPLLSPSPPAPNPSHIRVFSNESTLHMRQPKYWSFSFSISPSNEHPKLISLGWTG